LTEEELEAYEASRDLGAELLQSIMEMKAGLGTVVYSPVVDAREKTGLSRAHFASLMGVSVHTLQKWEQGRARPGGAARTLLAIALTNPSAIRALKSTDRQ
jgi:putative transcriptional regulator